MKKTISWTAILGLILAFVTHSSWATPPKKKDWIFVPESQCEGYLHKEAIPIANAIKVLELEAKGLGNTHTVQGINSEGKLYTVGGIAPNDRVYIGLSPLQFRTLLRFGRLDLSDRVDFHALKVSTHASKAVLDAHIASIEERLAAFIRNELSVTESPIFAYLPALARVIYVNMPPGFRHQSTYTPTFNRIIEALVSDTVNLPYRTPVIARYLDFRPEISARLAMGTNAKEVEYMQKVYYFIRSLGISTEDMDDEKSKAYQTFLKMFADLPVRGGAAVLAVDSSFGGKSLDAGEGDFLDLGLDDAVGLWVVGEKQKQLLQTLRAKIAQAPIK